MPELTPAQKRALDAIRQHGYAVWLYYSINYICGGTVLKGRVVDELRRKKFVHGVAVKPKQSFAGYTNRHRTTAHIVVPRE